MSCGSPASPEAGAGMAEPVKLFFDGSCRPNPGRIEIAVVAAGRIWHCADYPSGDNNDAEWLALLAALHAAREIAAEDIVLLGDSALVVNQASGRAPCRSARFQKRLEEFRTLAATFTRVRIRRIARAQNLAGIALERLHGKL